MSLAVDISPAHHPFVLGSSGSNVQQILLQSGATIHLPSVDSQIQHLQRGTFYLTGTMASVILARRLLLVCIQFRVFWYRLSSAFLLHIGSCWSDIH